VRYLLGPKLRQARERKVLTQVELAEQAGVSPQTIYQLERGAQRARPSTLRKLAQALGVQSLDLIELEP
jgi:transcriptional regulator with XRE-family HTH domain